jgi:hypothetical protein
MSVNALQMGYKNSIFLCKPNCNGKETEAGSFFHLHTSLNYTRKQKSQHSNLTFNNLLLPVNVTLVGFPLAFLSCPTPVPKKNASYILDTQ